MSALPDEIWMRILEMGTENSKLSYKDLCCVSISCKRLNRLSNEHTLWSTLLTLDFPLSTLEHPHSSSLQPLQSPSKPLYKSRFERDRDRKLAARRRAVFRIQSQIAVYSNNVKRLQRQSMEERERMNATVAELSNIEKARQASVALNVWQPEIIRCRQKQMVEQCVVPVESRITSLQMELRLCKQQIAVFDKACRVEKQRLDAAKEQLGSMKYHPLRDYQLTGTAVGERNIQKKKLK